jgi:hypothetical protein
MKSKSSKSDSTQYLIVAKINGAKGSIAPAATAVPASVVGSLASNSPASKLPSGKGRNRDPVPPGDEQPRAVIVQSENLGGKSCMEVASAAVHRQTTSSSAQTKLVKAVKRSDPQSSSASPDAHACMEVEEELAATTVSFQLPAASAEVAQPTTQPQPQSLCSDLSPEFVKALLSQIESHSSSEISLPLSLVRLLLSHITRLSSDVADLRRVLMPMGGGSLPGKEGPSSSQRIMSDVVHPSPSPHPSSPSPQPTSLPPPPLRGRPPQQPTTAKPPPQSQQQAAPASKPAKPRVSSRAGVVDSFDR